MKTTARATLVLLCVASFVSLGLPAAQAAPTCFGRTATIVGTDAPDGDNLNGTDGVDVIVGLGGRDQIAALGGDDFICGGDGGDYIQGEGGADRIKVFTLAASDISDRAENNGRRKWEFNL